MVFLLVFSFVPLFGILMAFKDYSISTGILVIFTSKWVGLRYFHKMTNFEDEDGRWLFSPSYSPENTPLHKSRSATINATMDIAVAKELFTNLITGCRTLGLEEEPITDWERMLTKMPEYQVNEEGALQGVGGSAL
jgi:alpha-L-fucosidase 2